MALLSARILVVPLLALVLVSAGCGHDSTMRHPMGPSPMSGAGMNSATGGGMNPGMGAMPGLGGGMGGAGNGMSMMVDSEFDYLASMIPHHEEAIAAAHMLSAGTRRSEMQQFAATIIRTQSEEVDQMRAWLAAWYPGRDITVDYRPMMRELTGLTGDALDRAFLQDMIPHHMMAVMMSQQLLARGLSQHQPVVPFATRIRDVQQTEIQMMRTWLRQWFGVLAAGS